MDNETYDIQELMKVSGIPRRTIHFYVQQRLLPPPEGAGLAAYYTGQHLVRLRLIPILRQQGLRLDDIRQRFEQMTTEEMQQAAPAQSQKAASGESSRAASDEARRAPSGGSQLPSLILRDSLLPASPAGNAQAARWLAERPFIHYQLPGGISVVAPADLAQPDQQRLARLLQAAAHIFERPISQPMAKSNGQSQSTADDNA